MHTLLRRCRSLAAAIAACLLTTAGSAALPRQPAPPAPVVIPFDLVLRHILVPVTVNGSEPLAFVLDSGDDVGIIDIDRAKRIGLQLGNQIKVGGAGAQLLTGAVLKDATFVLPTMKSVAQRLALALPLQTLAFHFGHDLDGIFGAEFIRQFVVEIDYQAKTLTLHDKDTFAYTGTGRVVPLQFNALHHPLVDVDVTPVGGTILKARCVLDIGSSGSLVLHTPFVKEHGLLENSGKTIRALGIGGAGGAITGRFGRVADLRIGGFVLSRPTTLFAQDAAGAFSSTAIQGNIGAEILMRFRVFFDYGRSRMILEPTAGVDAPFDRAVSGMSIESEGSGYRTFRVKDVLEDSPAAAAGVRPNDVITALDGKTSGEWTLSTIHDRLEETRPCTMTLRRGDDVVTVTVTPARLI